MSLSTPLTISLNIKHPIICGGMQYVGIADFASAISNAGGLGVITALTFETPELLKLEIIKMRSLTNKPFGVNLAILPALIPADYDSYINIICEMKVPVIEITGGSPKKYIKQLRDAGIKIIHKSATIKHALKAQEAGVDFIEIAGFESSIAGRSSEDDVGTWVLLAKALEVLKTPVIVSGASGTGRQLAAALTMGAVGITMGTRFMATQECKIPLSIKEHLADPKIDEFSTCLVLRSFNNSTRVIKNDISLRILELEKENPEFKTIAPLAKGLRTKKMFMSENGHFNDAMWSCGQSVGFINDIPTCKVLIERIVDDAVNRLNISKNYVVKSKM